ncbi:unnamed protein product, partial [Alternaria alternata]
MTVGFGFSVGDLIAVGKLAHEIANALSDCRGASAEYRSLIELLDSLKTSLNLIKSREQVSQISVTVAAIFDTVRTTQEMMPKMLGYPWEGDVLSSHVHIEDVLGRPIVLPIMLCRTRQRLKDTIRLMFSDHPGFKEVVDGNFELVDKQNQLTIFDGRFDAPE